VRKKKKLKKKRARSMQRFNIHWRTTKKKFSVGDSTIVFQKENILPMIAS
jgi:hypothetical protein